MSTKLIFVGWHVFIIKAYYQRCILEFVGWHVLLSKPTIKGVYWSLLAGMFLLSKPTIKGVYWSLQNLLQHTSKSVECYVFLSYMDFVYMHTVVCFTMCEHFPYTKPQCSTLLCKDSANSSKGEGTQQNTKIQIVGE